MQSRLHGHFLLLLCIPSILCITPLQYCGDGVQTAVSSFLFAGDTTDDYWANICTNELGVQSLGAGVKTYCSDAEREPSWELLQEYCSESALNLTDWSTLEPTLTDELVRSFEIVQFEDIDPTKIWNGSVLLSRTLYAASLRTTVSPLHRPRTLLITGRKSSLGSIFCIKTMGMANSPPPPRF